MHLELQKKKWMNKSYIKKQSEYISWDIPDCISQKDSLLKWLYIIQFWKSSEIMKYYKMF
jgi:hypothetical protein